MNNKEKRKTHFTIAFFSLFVLSALFYLSLVVDSGFLSSLISDTDSGTATNANVNINIIDASIVQSEENEDVTISSDGKKLFFNVVLGDSRLKIINFKVRNVGNRQTILNSLSTTNPLPSAGVTVVWPNLSGLVLKPFEESVEYSIIVSWNGTGGETTSTFSAELNYMEFVR